MKVLHLAVVDTTVRGYEAYIGGSVYTSVPALIRTLYEEWDQDAEMDAAEETDPEDKAIFFDLRDARKKSLQAWLASDEAEPILNTEEASCTWLDDDCEMIYHFQWMEIIE